MKKRMIALLLVTLMLACLFSGCKKEQAESGEGESESVDASTARIAELEATLQKEREENFITESELKQEIERLKTELAVLTGGDGTSEDNAGGAMVFHYTVEDGGATVTKYEGTATLVQIPATLDGYPVRKIGERAFEGNQSLAAVVVPEGVLTVDWFAFYNCASLFDITLPASVSLIGHAVFDGCPNLTIVCPAGSYTAEYAESYGISYLTK